MTARDTSLEEDSLEPPPTWRACSNRRPSALRMAAEIIWDSHQHDELVDLYTSKEFLLLPRVQIIVEVSPDQLFEDGRSSNFFCNLAQKVLWSLRGEDRYMEEAVHHFSLRPNSDLLIAAGKDNLIRKGLRSGECQWRLVACSQLSSLSCLCVGERNKVYFGFNVVLRAKGRDVGYLPTSPTTGVPLIGAALLAQMSLPRAGFSVVKSEKGFLAVGGFNRAGCTSQVETFTISANVWEPAEPLRSSRARFCAVNIDEDIYAIGGSDGRRELACMERFNKNNKQWENLNAAMLISRSCFAATVLDGKVYAVGGTHYWSLLKSVEMFDPAVGYWQPIASMSVARSDLSVATCAGKLYAIAGASYSWKCVGTVECYDPSENSWKTVAPLATARRNAAAASIQNKIYVAAGYDGHQVLTSVEMYDPSTDSWSSCSPMSVGRSSPAAIASDGSMFLVGGYTGVLFLNSLESYDPAKDEWTSYV